MKRKACILAGSLVICISSFSISPAQYSHHTIDFQGFLTDDLGNPLNDVVPITFKIYRSSPFFLLWTEVHPSVGVVDGVFNVRLGSIVPLDDIRFDRAYEVGIAVDGDSEISPRTPLTSVPYAMNLGGAFRVQLVDDSGVGVFDADNIIGGNGWVAADVAGATIGGGGNTDDFDSENRVYADYGTIGGGYGNHVGAFTEDNIPKTENEFATVGGGYSNAAAGEYSTVPGGYLNRALGRYSFAAGHRAEASHRSTFVWADSGSAFPSSGNDQFLVRAKGGVGFGTAYPLGQLVKTRPSQGTAYQLELRNEGNITAPNHDGIRFTQVTLPSDTPTNLAWIKVPYQNFGGADMEFGLRFHDEPILYLKNTGNVGGSPVRVGVGTSNPSHELDVNGNIEAVSLTETSDARYKRDVSELSNALDAIMSLQGVRFYWDRDSHPEKAFSDAAQLGFLAQDVQEVVPEVVSEGDDGSLSVAYGKLVPLLVEAIKEQQARIEILESEIAAIRAGM